ncbi:hypothetical protein BOX15_Mlig014701g2 [Macrostomum lignano]|uniref:C-type lectin domain-containing protein n=2 Tax=Macrostomum lignano TaxID=282301 RepID=A0A1I8IHX7_9PLAT|nr:hypothetical protein BOX15_Mlig014701g2 [Macrostomum lignano]
MNSARVWSHLLLSLLFVSSPVLSQKTFYCSKSAEPVEITDSDFTLYFTYGHRRYVSPNMDCNFVISDPNRTSGSLYMIEMLYNYADSNEHNFVIRDGNRTLMQNEVDFNHYIMITRTSSLTAHFLTRSLTYLNLHGYCLKFTRFTGCPPGWTSLGDVCISSGSGQGVAGRGYFSQCQAKCNNMRSNLLTLPLLQRAGIRSVKELAERFRFPHPVWIGLTDNTTAGPGKLYWLDGTPLDIESADWIQCDTMISNPPPSHWSSRGCGRDERTAYLWLTAKYFITMTQGNSMSRNFVCAMPSGGTDEFFPIPSGQRPPSKLQLLWLLLLVPLSAGFIALWLQARRRRQNYQAIGANVEPSGFIIFRWITI